MSRYVRTNEKISLRRSAALASSRVISSPVAHRDNYRIRNKRESRAVINLLPEARGGNHPPVVSEACLPVEHRRRHHECYHLHRPRPPCTGQPALCRPRDREAVRQGCTLTPEARHHLPGRSILSWRLVLLGTFPTVRDNTRFRGRRHVAGITILIQLI